MRRGLSEYHQREFPDLAAIASRRLRRSIPELEKLTLTFSLTKLREVLGPDDAFVKKVLGSKSPAELATELVDGTGLANVETAQRSSSRPTQAAIDASTDPMIAFVAHDRRATCAPCARITRTTSKRR